MNKTIRLSYLLFLVKKYWLFIGVVMIVAVLAGVTITKFVITPTYSASSWVVAKPPSSETSDANDIQLLNTYKNIVTSDVVLDDVKKKLEIPDAMDISKQINISNDSNSRALEISAKDNDAARAVELVNQTAQSLKKEVKKIWDMDSIQIISLSNMNKIQDPVSPNLKTNLFIAVIMGLLVSGLGIIVIELIKSPLRTDNEIREITQIPIIGHIINYTKTKKDSATRKILTGYSGGNSLINHAVEDFRMLCANLTILGKNKHLKTFTFTSIRGGEGKSSTVANVAAIFGNQNLKVLVIDADLRLPKQHKIWRTSNSVGLADVMLSNLAFKEAVQSSYIDQVDLITSGTVSVDPSNLLSNQSVKALLSWAKEEYDFVLIDAPPSFISDTFYVAKESDGTILVVEMGKTTKQKFAKGLSDFNLVNLPIYGIVKNKVQMQEETSNYYL
ncbi:polysaccharide biosynthesis tyrosine autokinase [Listeria aquatica]|uniref:Polysaccharide biosynthesis tyrosine autokinase n=1 Tax=Listeria aquatica TaxID=1494960 RepID=A0A841ZT34_9LIST|nr:polysaccharide biosynthesis tyrosine autokinase [Listeria aquatica]MBC1522325.1 polysaccharide biosynthesis tyrosine autokinase [Listeria aquatica]